MPTERSVASDHRVEVVEVVGPNYVVRCSCGWSSTDWPRKEIADRARPISKKPHPMSTDNRASSRIEPPQRDPRTGEPLTTATPPVATSVEHGHLCWLARAVLEGAAVVFEDERVKYVEVQIDRADWLRWKEATDG